MRNQFELTVTVDRNVERQISNLLSENVTLGQGLGEQRHTNINRFLKESPKHSAAQDFGDTDNRSYRRLDRSR